MDYLQTLRNETNNISQLVSPHSLVSSADSQFLYVACSQSVVVFKKVSDRYVYLQTISNSDLGVSGLSGAAGVALSADEHYVFVASEIDGALVTFIRTDDGLLHFHSSLQEKALEGASFVTVSNNGRYLFVTAGNEGNSLSIYEIKEQ